MGDRHLSLETMAKWLTGRLEHDDLIREVVPHHLEQCPGCREVYETLDDLKREVGHWDEEVALLETREAPDLAARLDRKAPEARADLIDEDESLHTWGLCHLLLERSLAAARQDPGAAFDLADQAVRLTAHLGSTYDPQWVLGLRARALAYRANARRVLGELRSSESDFRQAHGCLERSGMEGSHFEAEVLDLESSLCRDQRRFGVALDLAQQALDLYRKLQDPHGTAKMFLKKIKILEDSNDLEGAIELLRRPEDSIDPEREPHLYTTARYNLVSCLSDAGLHREAESLLPEVRARFRETAHPLDRVRLRWTEAGIAFGLGEEEDAEAAFREVQAEFLSLNMDYNAALVALDLAVLLSKQGRGAELKQLAVELMAAFESKEIYRESTAVLILFQRACEEERMTAELARELAGLLRRGRGSEGATRP
jgi:tetratricopeptide (TPR) repeat protein